jgi:NADH dehydrogenase
MIVKLHKQVVTLGGGFGGLAATRALTNEPVHVTLVDRRNHHLFQPLLYQVAMAGLSPAEIAVPIRSILRKQANARVLLGEVHRIDMASQRVFLREAPALPYDYLVVATGAKTSYFGHEQWQRVAPGLKDIEDAVEIRRRVLLAFEKAERDPNPETRRFLLTFIVIGGGPTGVELAGAIAELASYVLARDFRTINPENTRVLLLEGGLRILNTFAPEISKRAMQSLHDMGVEVRTTARVTQIDDQGVLLNDERILAGTVLWAAGVAAATLPDGFDVPKDSAGRVLVTQDCRVPGYPQIFCIGDAASFLHTKDGKSLPGVSAVAMQQGRFVAQQIIKQILGQPTETFVYLDKGSMATIGRKKAVAEIGKLQLSGFIAWLTWLLVHIYYLVGFRNRIFVILSWAWSYLTYRRGARLITGRDPPTVETSKMPGDSF